MSILFTSLQQDARLAKASQIQGLEGLAADFFAAYYSQSNPCIIITKTQKEAENACSHLKVLGRTPVVHFPAWDIIPTRIDDLDDKILAQRTQAMCALNEQKDAVIIACAQALSQGVLAQEIFSQQTIILKAGSIIERDTLLRQLEDIGLSRSVTATDPGNYAVKGAVVDIYPFAGQLPVRLEFFDDEVDTLKSFDPQTQKSTQRLKQYIIHSAPLEQLRQAAYADTPDRKLLTDYAPKQTKIIYYDHDALQATIDRDHLQLAQSLADYTSFNICPYQRQDIKDAININTLSLNELTHKDLIDHFNSEHFTVMIVANEDDELKRVKSLASQQLPEIPLHFQSGHLHESLILNDYKLAIVSATELLGSISPKHSPARQVPKRDRANINTFTDLEEGDYVVHSLHGIGRFMMIETIDRPNGTSVDCLNILYADSTKLLVPMNNLYLVQKYIGKTEDGHLNLDKIGAASWLRKKKKAQKSIEKMAIELLELQAAREKFEGFAFAPDNEEQHRFEREFVYEDTPDQSTASAEIKFDMERAQPMDRLLCGDVGFGKTEVAMRAAFKAVQSGKQVAILVPTTILAEQHCRSFNERMEGFPVIIETLNRFRTPKEQKKTIEHMTRGSVDIVIGTHRLLSKDIEFKDLGLVIIDEEQRFGVKAKEHLKTLRNTVDVLAMSATPIPRTLHMGFVTLKDISTLKTPPAGRLAIHSSVVHEDEHIIREAITRELKRGGQVFFVHDRVKSMPGIVQKLQEIVPDASIATLHGQMPGAKAEATMMNFMKGHTKILVATTIIESGLDIPNANTIFINNADNFGLAELHQLRGRIGRYKYTAYAYFLIDPEKDINPVAKKRLKAIADFSAIGAGFDLAMQDLEIRGSGNLLGKQQHGHIEDIGYELYCHMLQDAVAQLRGETTKEDFEVKINLGQDAFIPDNYICDHRHKIEIYRQLSQAESIDAIDELSMTLLDRYGHYPEPVRGLIEEAKITLLARRINITRVAFQQNAIQIATAGLDSKALVVALGENKWKIQRITEKAIHLQPRDASIPGQVRMMLQDLQVLNEVEKVLEEV